MASALLSDKICQDVCIIRGVGQARANENLCDWTTGSREPSPISTSPHCHPDSESLNSITLSVGVKSTACRYSRPWPFPATGKTMGARPVAIVTLMIPFSHFIALVQPYCANGSISVRDSICALWSTTNPFRHGRFCEQPISTLPSPIQDSSL